ncbi:MAG: stage 0 sporulation family protein, partial [Oscillospiraceae bacterium]|nr:stage 0 sporulation family protein [Oscillospiraceae bacterium]
EMIRRTNLEKEREALRICQQKIEEHKLDMLLVAAEYAFDGGKILFFFTSEGRVDFRELVKDLASTLHTRIELRQIGVRDKAKMVGGLGICGRPFCCKQFLDDFEPVSIKMAKTQNLSLNPTKISGTCGRLMCCLKYEQEAYEDLIKTVPKADSFVDTPDGRGTVTDVNLLRQTVRVRMERSPDEFGTYPIGEIYVIRNGKAKKGDPPIPEDFAPISSAPRRPRMVQEEAMPDVVLIRDQTEEAAQPESEEAAPQRRRRRRGKHAGGEQPEAAPAAEKPAEAAAPEQKKSRYRRRPRRRGGKNNPPV